MGTKNWPEDGKLLTVLPQGAQDSDRLLKLEIDVMLPIFRNLASLHRTQEYQTKLPKKYKYNLAGDIFPLPQIKRHDSYHSLVQPMHPNMFPNYVSGSYPDVPNYLAVPSGKELGFNLRTLGKSIFKNSGPVTLEKIQALRQFFQKNNFKYSRTMLWKNQSSILQDFLYDSRKGNCSFFATSSALLLRTAGVSTRMVAGYMGGDWNEEKSELLLRISMIHGWVEVYFPVHGWFPLDATAWVPVTAESNTGDDDSGPFTAQPSNRDDSSDGQIDTQRKNPFHDPDNDQLRSKNSRKRGSDSTRNGKDRDFRRPPDDPKNAEEEELMEWIQFDVESGKERNPAHGREELKSSAGKKSERANRKRLRQALSDSREEKVAKSTGTLNSILEKLKLLLRILLVSLACCALYLLFESFRRSRKQEEELIEESQDQDKKNRNEKWTFQNLEELSFDPLLPREVIIGGYHELQADLVYTRNHRKSSQTPLEHSRKFFRQHDKIRLSFQIIVELFYRAFYSPEEVTSEDAQKFRENCRRIKRALR